MSQRRATRRNWSRAALALAPILVLAACDQLSSIFQSHPSETAGPAPLDSVPMDARAVSGSLQSEEAMAALLAPEPVLVAPGEILVGAKVEAQLDDTARAMGLARNLIQGLQASGMQGLNAMPSEVRDQLRARAEQEASTLARDGARDVLQRLGVQGEIDVTPGGMVRIDLITAGASPTVLHFAQQGAEAAGGAQPVAVEWNPSDGCPALVTQAQLENDVALATRCAIQRLAASRKFDYVEPNYIVSSGFSWPPRRDQPAKQNPTPTTNPPPANQGSNPAPSPAPTGSQESGPSEAPAPVAEEGGAPNDPLFALQWDFLPAGAGQGQSPGGAGFTAFWDAHIVGKSDVRVAVIDTGLDLTHPEMAGSPNIAPGIDLISNPERAGDNDGIDNNAQDAGDHCGTTTEDSFHGTHVAGTIGAGVTNNRIGVAGGAWHVTVVPVRVLGRCGGELADIASGIRWAAGLAPAVTASGQQIVNANPADIINMSLSLQAPCPVSMQSAIDAAIGRGSVIVVAAGNKANQASLYAPANCNNVIVVAAGEERGQLAFYSNFGPQVDILAPGGDVFADSDNDGKPDGILSTRATQSGCYDPLNQSSTERCFYSYLQGTSMAAPHVSAALALLGAETGLRGRPLEDALFTRAVAPFEPNFGQIECARSRNAMPLTPGSTTCARPAGRGRLDLARAAPVSGTPAAP